MEAYDVKSQKGTNVANSITAIIVGIIVAAVVAYFVSIGTVSFAVDA